jgi:peptidoglycan/xylan/chitin deacetylase (PgdA/CDA1 family)
MKRNFIGYGKEKPKLFWPDGNKLAISIVVNIEEGAELSVSSGDNENEHIYENNKTKISNNITDLCMESHYEYGLRSGIWRIFNLFDEYKIKATFSCCSRALERSPWLINEILNRKHEISAHGVKWISHAYLNKQEEKDIIDNCYSTILKLSGQPPMGWHTKSSTSPYTRELLINHGGFIYDSNAYNDDLPYVLEINKNKIVIIPYSFDTNDMRFDSNGGFVQGEDFYNYCRESFDQLLKETKDGSIKMMSIGLHPRIIGRPGRIKGLESFLNYIASKKNAWITRRIEIAKFCLQENTFKQR